jgi:arginine deiminase
LSTKLRREASVWQEHKPFRNNLRGNPIKILTLQEMLKELYQKTKNFRGSFRNGQAVAGYQGFRLKALIHTAMFSSATLLD